MNTLHGAYLLLTLSCTLYVIRQYIVWSQKCTTPRAKKVATIVACLLVAFLWWFQNEYRHKHSPEAQAMMLFDKLLDDWQRGKKEKVLVYLGSLADSERPWERSSVSGKPIEP